MNLVAWGETDVGLKRDHNEDAIVVDPETNFFMVADGVGGNQAGEVASGTCANVVAQRLEEFIRAANLVPDGQPPPDFQNRVRQALEGAINSASDEIYSKAQNNPRMRGMATTAVGLQIVGSIGVIGHVGDSRLYMVRQGRIYQVTEDHSLLQQMLQTGVLTAEEAKDFPHKNVLARSVGKSPAVKVDTVVVDVAPGDRFVICSDGLSDLVSAEVIQNSVVRQPPRDAVKTLIAKANEAGGRDNISVIVIEAKGEAAPVRQLRTEHKVELLSSVFLFKSLSFQETMRVLAVVNEHWFDPGATILREGESGNEFYVLVEGDAVVSKNAIPLTTIRPGGHFGELALLGDGVRSATVTAKVRTVCLSITKQDFYNLVSTDHGLSVKLLWGFLQNVAGRMKALSGEVSDLRAASMAPTKSR